MVEVRNGWMKLPEEGGIADRFERFVRRKAEKRKSPRERTVNLLCRGAKGHV
jgi:hypothetical protein